MTDSLLHEFQFSLFPSIQALCNPLSLSMGGTHDLFLIQEYGRAVDRLQMETYTMFFDWKTQYCQNDYNTQGNLQIQCNLYQITNGIFYKTRTKMFLICMEIQKIPKSNTRLRKKNRAGGLMLPDFTLYYYTKLQYSK